MTGFVKKTFLKNTKIMSVFNEIFFLILFLEFFYAGGGVFAPIKRIK